MGHLNITQSDHIVCIIFGGYEETVGGFQAIILKEEKEVINACSTVIWLSACLKYINVY